MAKKAFLFSETQLDNGLLVDLRHVPNGYVAIRAEVSCGALDESAGQEGYAHFDEHVQIEGGTRNFSPERVDWLTRLWGYHNAYTSRSCVAHMDEVLPEHLNTCLAWLAETLSEPAYDERCFREQRKVVLRELADGKSDSSRSDMERFFAMIYGPDSPHTYEIAGKEDALSAATPNDLRDFHMSQYFPNRTRLVMVGDFPADTLSVCEGLFKGWRTGPATHKGLTVQDHVFSPGILHVPAPDLRPKANLKGAPTAFVYLCSPAPRKDNPDTLVADVLGEIFSERLYDKIRENMGCAYSIGAGHTRNNYEGWFTVIGQLASDRVPEAMDAIFNEMERLKQEPPRDSELELRIANKRYMKALENTNSEAVSDILNERRNGEDEDEGLQPLHMDIFGGHEAALGLTHPRRYGLTGLNNIDEVLSMLGRLKPEDVCEAARKYFPSQAGKDYALLIRDPTLPA